MQLPKKVEEFAPAKINLTLHVTGRRADGYHLLDSLVVFADAGDTVRVAEADAFGFSVTGPFAGDVPSGAGNLVYKAASVFRPDLKAKILLHKALPAAAGLGGGSSDAAACLRGLSRISGQPLPEDEQVLDLGADVPVCLLAEPARMQGIGEHLTPLPALPDLWLAVINPGVAVPTGDVFRALAGQFGAPMPAQIPNFSTAAALAQWLASQRNDLEPAAVTIAPTIETCLAALRQQKGCLLARMSGSGASCFGVFSTEAEAQTAVAEIGRQQPAWWVMATRATEKRVS